MYTRGVRVQLVAFGAIAVVAIGYLVLGYADGERTLGITSYQIKADFDDTSGLYPRALVTYRGVQVGRVKSLDLSADGVGVTLALDSNVRVPVGARAEIHSTSAIGEQYVDLVPGRRGGPVLPPGSTIPRADTREMPQIAPVLDKLNGLLESVPKQQTETLLNDVDTALGSSAGDLQEVLASSTDLVAEATAQVESTKQLLASAQPVLKSQADLGSATRSYISSLAGVSDELGGSDAHLRSLLTNGAPALDSVDGLVNHLSPSFSILMANLVSSGEVFNMYVPNINQLLVIYPALIDRLQGTGLAHKAEGIDTLDIKLNFNDPAPCTQGYIPGSHWRDPSDTTRVLTPPALHCTMPASAPESVRGARNLPCPNDGSRRVADPAGCGLTFPGEQSAAYVPGRATTSARSGAAPADEGSISYTLVQGTAAWSDLFTEPLQ
jgi:phospholipid/cholesterol/gamma-HCH transport system substrate-binding protein